MLESLVENKIAFEKNEVGDIEPITKDVILKKNLSDFTKNYIINDITQTADTNELLVKIEKANKLYFNYAIRPKWTLLAFLFNDFESRPPSEILKKINLFPFYSYYIDAIRNLITDNFQIFVTKSEVTALIDETNKAIYEKLTKDINSNKIKNFFLQIFKFKYGDETKWNLESTVPYPLIRIFLEDKLFDDLVNKFKSSGDFSDDTEISLMNVIKILTDKYVLPVKEEPVVKLPEPAKKESVISKAPEKTAEKKLVFDKTKETEKKTNETSPDKKIYSEQLINASSIKPQTAEKEKPLKKSNGYNLKDLFNEKQLDRISNKIYNKNLISMDRSFEKLNHFKTWFEASNHLKEIFRNNRVDIYNKDVIWFVDAVSEFYKDRE